MRFALLGLLTMALTGPAAFSADAKDCKCATKCSTSCENHKGHKCKCDCGCKDGKCSHNKCSHAAAPAADAPQVKHIKAVAAPAAPDATRYLQITGLRITEVNHKPQISMVVVNHAAAELVDVKANVLIHTTKDGADATPKRSPLCDRCRQIRDASQGFASLLLVR